MKKQPDGQIRRDPPGVDNSGVFGVEKIKVQQGDTLSDLAKKYSVDVNQFQGYRSGNKDLIFPGEELTVRPKTSIVSSNDVAQTFKNDSNRIDQIDQTAQSNFQQDFSSKLSELGIDKIKTDTGAGSGSANEKADTSSGKLGSNPLRDQVENDLSELKDELDEAAEEARANYRNLFNTSLASVDATLQSTLLGINSLYDQRIKEQQRINQLRIDRTKAYGLGGSGQYVPIMFTDAVTNREEEASREIASLEGKRQAAISEAKAARDTGEQQLLRAKLEDLDNIDEQLRNNIERARTIAEQEYTRIKEERKEAETARQEEIAKVLEQFTSIAGTFADDYSNADEATKLKIIEEIKQQTGLKSYQIIGELEKAVRESRMNTLEEQKKAQEVKTEEQQTEAARALAGQRWASASKTKAETGGDVPEDMPDEFVNEDDFNKKRQEFIKKHGEDGRKYWDDVYGIDYNQEYIFETTENDSTPMTSEEARKKYNY